MLVPAVAALLMPSTAVLAEPTVSPDADAEESASRRYSTREERREAGIRHRVYDWLSVAGLAELEVFYFDSGVAADAGRSRADETTKTIQLGAELTPADRINLEVYVEYEDEINAFRLDEALLAVELGEGELELGRYAVPFGEYFSRFATGPLVEFGETSGRAVTATAGFEIGLDISVFAYRGDARAESNGRGLDWGFALEGAFGGAGNWGLSYLSDLADADERPLADEGNRYRRRVDAVSGHAVVGFHAFELSAEFVAARRPFAELDAAFDRPRAWNLELAWYPLPRLETALRIEGSRELEDAPRSQVGVAVSIQPVPTMFLTLDYLHGRFARGAAEDDAGRALDSVNTIGALLSIEF